MTWGWLALTRLHGVLGVLCLALLLHPVLGLRRASGVGRRARLSATLATALLGLTVAGGWLIYPAYRLEVRAALYGLHRALGLAFETKEHLAFHALMLALAGVVAAWRGGARAAPLVRRLYGASFALALVSGLLGLGLGVAAGFPRAAG